MFGFILSYSTFTMSAILSSDPLKPTNFIALSLFYAFSRLSFFFLTRTIGQERSTDHYLNRHNLSIAFLCFYLLTEDSFT